MKADTQTETAVMASLNEFCRAYQSRDLDGMVALLAPDPDLVVLGPGPDEEQRVGWVAGSLGLAETQTQIERDWSQSEASSMEITWSAVSAASSVAWLAAHVTRRWTAGKEQGNISGRLTAVLEKRKGRWLLLQLHFSLPYGLKSEGE